MTADSRGTRTDRQQLRFCELRSLISSHLRANGVIKVRITVAFVQNVNAQRLRLGHINSAAEMSTFSANEESVRGMHERKLDSELRAHPFPGFNLLAERKFITEVPLRSRSWTPPVVSSS